MAIETQTKIGLISRALILCGEKALNSLDDDRYGAEVGGNLFELIYENELASNPWRFAMKKATLSRLNVTPVNQFDYAHQIPADCLIPRHVYPRTVYEIYGDRIYSNNLTIELDYSFKPGVDELPSYFSMLMVYALAKDMIKPITESTTATEVMTKKYILQRDRALFADAQARPSTPIQDQPFVQVRS